MPSKEKLKKKLGQARKDLIEISEELAELDTEWLSKTADYEGTIASQERVIKSLRADLQFKVDQSRKMDEVVRERDKYVRELQAARAAATQLQKALFPSALGSLGGAQGRVIVNPVPPKRPTPPQPPYGALPPALPPYAVGGSITPPTPPRPGYTLNDLFSSRPSAKPHNPLSDLFRDLNKGQGQEAVERFNARLG